MSNCTFPGCVFHAEKNNYCIRHRMYSNAPIEVKQKKPIAKKSEKKIEIDKQLKKSYPIYLKENPVCKIQSPACTQKATCVNHTQGRGVNEILNQSTWEPSCVPCNHWVEENHALAEAGGHKISRHQKKGNEKR